MATISASVRIDESLYKESREVFEKLGMPFSVGINIYLEYVVRKQGIPFALQLEDSNIDESERRSSPV